MRTKSKFLRSSILNIFTFIAVFSLQSLHAQVFKPAPNIADDVGNWSSTDAIEVQIQHDGFTGVFLTNVLGVETGKLHHAQHIVRLPNVTGDDGQTRAYFAITHSNKYFEDADFQPDGFWMVAEINPDSFDAATDQIIDMPGSDGQFVFEEHFTNTKPGPIFGTSPGQDQYAEQIAERPEQFVLSSAGDWNHPGKMAGFDGILLIAAQQFSAIAGTKIGESPDAVLFYDVRNPVKPVYLGLVDAFELGLGEGESGGGRDVLASVGLTKFENGYYHLGVETQNYTCHEDSDCFAAPMNAEIFFSRWTSLEGDHNFSGQLGQIFQSREIYDEVPADGEPCFEGDSVICEPAGTVRSIYFKPARTSVLPDGTFSDDNANMGVPQFGTHLYNNLKPGETVPKKSYSLNDDTQSYDPGASSHKNKFYTQLTGDCAPNGSAHVNKLNEPLIYCTAERSGIPIDCPEGVGQCNRIWQNRAAGAPNHGVVTFTNGDTGNKVTYRGRGLANTKLLSNPPWGAGDSEEFTGDQISRVEAIEGEWLLYEGNHFYGLSEDRVANNPHFIDDDQNIFKDISSFRTVPEEGISLFEHAQFQGRMVNTVRTLSRLAFMCGDDYEACGAASPDACNIDFLGIDDCSNYRTFNDTTSSAIVGSDSWELFGEDDFNPRNIWAPFNPGTVSLGGGEIFLARDGAVPNMDFRGWDDRVSGARVTLIPKSEPAVPFKVEIVSTDEFGFASGTITLSKEPGRLRGVDYFLPDNIIELTAVPAIESEFVSWGGSLASCGTNITCAVTIVEGLDLQAIFRPKPLLSVDIAGSGNGSINTSEFGSGCADSLLVACRRYSTGTEVELIAAPTPGTNSIFVGWEGDCSDSGADEVVQITMDKDKRCTARFDKTAYQLTVTGVGGSVESSSSDAIDCGADCTETYQAVDGTKTEILIATADPGFIFVRWYGDTDCYDEDEGDGDPKKISLTVGDRDLRCSAMIVPIETEFALSVEKTGPGVGEVTAAALPLVDSSEIDCALPACSQKYLVNTVVQLTATPERGSLFAEWDGDPDCEDGMVTMTRSISCSARFTAAVLLVDGSNDDNLRSQFDNIFTNTPVGGDFDYWSVQDENAEPQAVDLSVYSRVVWYTGNTTSQPIAGPSPAAETALGGYLDDGGCFLLSSSEYFAERGITPFARTYLGVESMIDNIGDGTTHDLLVGTGLNSRFDIEGSRITGDEGMNLSLSDSIEPASTPGVDVLLTYADGGNAAISMDNDTSRTAFFGFPFLGLKSGNSRNNVMNSFLNYCGAKELDDLFENNDSFDEASRKSGGFALENLKIMPGNEDYFRWLSDWSVDTEVSITFSHATGDLSLEVYDGNKALVASSLSVEDNESVIISNVLPGEIYFVRIFGVDEAASRYTLNITNAVAFEASDATLFMITPPVDVPSFAESDFDLDGIVDSLDLDDDNDGLPDTYELANGLDPFDASDAGLDNDSDGLTNFEEFRIGTDINLADTDGDGINDNIDNNPLVFDEVDATLYSGQFYTLPDMNADGVAEIGILSVDVLEVKVRLEILDGKNRASLDEIVWADNFSDTTLSLHVIADMNNNGVDEVGLFGIQDITNNEGKPQMFVRDLKTGNKVGDVYNWVANWKEVSALILDDMTGDGIAEIAIQGRFEEGNRPQLVVKIGNTNTILDTYSYPDLFVAPQYYQHSDIDGDGSAEISTFGRLSSNNKIQVKIASGIDSTDKLKAYNFPDKWDDISWHRLDDSNGDGQDDWGMFGTFREDGRPQLVNKDGVSPAGALRIFAWPAEMENAQFFRIPDMNNDGVDEVAAAGRRSNNGRYQFQIQDGTDRNVLVANHNLNLDLESVTYHVLPDLSGDEKAEIGFMGVNQLGEYELVIRHGDAANGEYASLNLGSDWQSAPNITSLGDTDDDGLPDLMVYGQNASGVELVITSL